MTTQTRPSINTIIKSPKAALAVYFGFATMGDLDDHQYRKGRFTKNVWTFGLNADLYCAAKAQCEKWDAQPLPQTRAGRDLPLKWAKLSDTKAKAIQDLHGYEIFKCVGVM
ncbi:MAG: hypothetical protein EXR21_09215 [Flavobacteriaceae bacterium]|nr:hypothetical protein [Flavobacteriaceae bacterium]